MDVILLDLFSHVMRSLLKAPTGRPQPTRYVVVSVAQSVRLHCLFGCTVLTRCNLS